MSIFSKIWDRITGRNKPAPAPAPTAGTAAPAPTAAVAPAVDVEAVLVAMAEAKGGGGNWRTSIVDLLKLLDLDSSLDARKELGGAAMGSADRGDRL